eukprot:TRINITY_DN75610_c0_g1_i1.p1 TRINITY_DN75610_c0_g1~~TRINITY_DN75610_c0_g1_i1.p1  ORF type:complete len:902 (-),score=146.41 TRINITY_DN75610_c0_g1_i1:39-2744(-)
MLLHLRAFGLELLLLLGSTSSERCTVGAFLQPLESRWQRLLTLARQVSDPLSPSYGDYLSQAALAEQIGIPRNEATRTAAWLRAVLAKGVDQDEKPHIVAHGDAVTMEVDDFFATYSLGSSLREVRAQHSSLSLPESVRLVITPPMPDGLCHKLNRSEDCNFHRPCHWRPEAHNKTGRCHGDFAGWICWRAPMEGMRMAAEWDCIEPADLLGINDTDIGAHRDARKRRRRGRRSDLSTMYSDANHTNSSEFQFRAVARSGSIVLALKEKPERRNTSNESKLASGFSNATDKKQHNLTAWHSIELSFVQSGRLQNLLLERKDFVVHGNVQVVEVPGLENLRPVSTMFACINEERTALLRPAFPGQPGCDCELAANEGHSNAGRDRRLKGRRCERVEGMVPSDEPLHILLPRAPQALEALRRDLHIPPGKEFAVASTATQAVGQFNGEAFSQEDLVKLHAAYGLGPMHPANVSVQGVCGKVDSVDMAGEGSLDLQVITSLAAGAPTTWWGISEHNMDGFMMAYSVQVNDHPFPPLVHSISWGDAEPLFPAAFVERLDYELMKLALRGITVIVASGDNGNSAVGTDCEFVSDLIGSSPWVTSVGATMPSLESAPYCHAEDFFKTIGTCEELGQATCSTAHGALITSSGYFSLYRQRPGYQDLALGPYLKSSLCKPFDNHIAGAQRNHSEQEALAPCQHISKHGCSLSPLVAESRASPDVALPGQMFPVIVNGSVQLFDGTSASAPAFAALVSLLNSEQQRQGRPPLGFLNAWLYQAHAREPSAFLDVVVGDTASSESKICPSGWKAGPGWDPATGLGVPRLATLRALLPERGCQIKTAYDKSTEQLAETSSLFRPDVHSFSTVFRAPLACTTAAGMVLVFLAGWLRRRQDLPWVTLSRQPLLSG